MVSMAGVEGTFEIKINTVQHSTPINGEASAGNSPPVTTTPVTPADIDYSGYPDSSVTQPLPSGNG